MKYLLKIITTPSCWFRNYRTNYVFDAFILEQLKNPKFSKLTNHKVLLNGIAFWIENYPYAYCRDYSRNNIGMPTRATVFKFKEALEKYHAETLRKNNE